MGSTPAGGAATSSIPEVGTATPSISEGSVATVPIPEGGVQPRAQYRRGHRGEVDGLGNGAIVPDTGEG